MDGYSVDDTYLEIDHEMEQESDIIKIKLKKDGSPYSNAKIISQIIRYPFTRNHFTHSKSLPTNDYWRYSYLSNT